MQKRNMTVARRATKRKIVYRQLCIAGMALLGMVGIRFILPAGIWAQTGQTWSMPQELGLLTNDYNNQFPIAAADDFGQVHVVVARNPVTEELGEPYGVLYYTVWRDGVWSRPRDILMAKGNVFATARQIHVTDTGYVHLLWRSQQDGLQWSTAHVAEAEFASSWSTQSVAAGTDGDFIVNSDEDVAIAYVQNNRNLIFLHTSDGGGSWDIETPIWESPTGRQAVSNPRLLLDETGAYHVVWGESDAAFDWNPSGIGYARSLDGGRTWQDYLYIEDEGSYPNLGFDRDGNLHMVWNHNVGSEDGRYHALSRDRGATWSEPEVIFEGLSGRTGAPQLLLDGGGTLHHFTSGRGFGRDGNIMYSQWLGDRWSDLQLITPDEERSNYEGPAVAVTDGNQLHLIYRRVRPDRDILHNIATLEAPSVAVQPLPVTPERNPVSIQESATLSGTAGVPAAEIEASESAAIQSTITPAIPDFDRSPSAPIQRSAPPYALALIPPILLIGVIALMRQFGR